MKRLLAIAIALASFPVLAADATGTASDFARALIPKEAWEQFVQNLARGVQTQMQNHPSANLHYPPDFADKVKREVEAAIPYDAIIALNAKELAAAYTEPELKELLAFWRSPIGQKYLRLTPTVTGKVAAETQHRVDQKIPEVMRKLSKLAQESGGAGGPPAAGGAK